LKSRDIHSSMLTPIPQPLGLITRSGERFGKGTFVQILPAHHNSFAVSSYM